MVFFVVFFIGVGVRVVLLEAEISISIFVLNVDDAYFVATAISSSQLVSLDFHPQKPQAHIGPLQEGGWITTC